MHDTSNFSNNCTDRLFHRDREPHDFTKFVFLSVLKQMEKKFRNKDKSATGFYISGGQTPTTS